MADDRMPALNARFGADPDALAWARGHVEALRDKCREFQRQAAKDGDPEQAALWRHSANLLNTQLIGGHGCVITPFDERRPSLPDAGEVAF